MWHPTLQIAERWADYFEKLGHRVGLQCGQNGKVVPWDGRFTPARSPADIYFPEAGSSDPYAGALAAFSPA